MKTVGIIAEFNPFHNGHKYLIEEAKQITGADYCIVVMSGDFVQRGGPAMTNKYIRAHMALLNGADLVLELPVCYATGSAEFFAQGAVALLDKIGVTDVLFFGSECGEVLPLMETARFLSDENPCYKSLLQNHLKSGLSFPAARLRALQSYCGKDESGFSSELLDSPNNILGIEYCKALLLRNSAIRPQTILRMGAGYHDRQLTPTTFGSASAIRNCLCTGGRLEYIKDYIPSNILPFLDYLSSENTPVHEDDFSLLLHYKLLIEASSGYTKFLDVSEDLSDKINKYLHSFADYSSFCSTLKSKDLTFSRISRCLLHILLDIHDTEMALYQNNNFIFYARMLGFRKAAGELLHAIKKNSSVPLLSKLADAPSLLTEIGLNMLQKDVQTTHIYDAVYSAKYGTSPSNEYTRQLLYI